MLCTSMGARPGPGDAIGEAMGEASGFTPAVMGSIASGFRLGGSMIYRGERVCKWSMREGVV